MEVDVVPNLSNSLIGFKLFVDAGCISIFHPHQGGVTIHHQDDVHIKKLSPPIIKGVREEAVLWKFPLTNDILPGGYQPYATGHTQNDPHTDKQSHLSHDTPTEQAHKVYELPSIFQGIKLMHAVCGYPVKSTWRKAIRAVNYVGYPILSIENIYKNYPETEETPKVHLNKSRQNVRSTKPNATPPPTKNYTTLQGKRSRNIYFKVYEAKNNTYAYQTGRFPFHSQRGYKYIMVIVEVDTNATLVNPLKNSTYTEIQRGCITLLNRIILIVITPKFHILYNERSKSTKPSYDNITRSN